MSTHEHACAFPISTPNPHDANSPLVEYGMTMRTFVASQCFAAKLAAAGPASTEEMQRLAWRSIWAASVFLKEIEKEEHEERMKEHEERKKKYV